MVQFTKLRLSGFKSFLHPTEIEIGPGKTGVVGPNGCGKSNLLEALSWVMGENSAKRMRGSGMEDVIFNGTNNKAARSSAEVTVWLDNSDKTAPPPYHDTEELEITRYIERGSGSDYKINGKSVRAKDVQLLFADLVSGANSPALVSQGRITGIIQAKPKDRRRILEDAAGITGLHARRHESELKLKATENNLERLADVITTQETHLNGLKKQARLASRYRNLSHHIKKAEANLYAYKWHDIAHQEKASKHDFDEIEAVIREQMSLITTLTTKHTEAAALIPDLRQEEAKAAAILQRLLIEQENQEQAIQRQLEAIERAKNALTTAQNEYEREEGYAQESQTKIKTLLSEKTEISSSNETDQEEINRLQTELDTLKKQADETQASYHELNQAIITNDAAVNGLQNQKVALEGQIANLVEEKKKYEERLEQIKAQQQQQTLFDGLKADIESGEKEIQALKEQRDLLEEQKTTQEKCLQEQREIVSEKQSDFARVTAEYDALTEIVQSGNDENHPPLLDQIKVEDGYERALAAALGEGLSYPLIEEALIYWSKLGEKAIDQPLPTSVTSILNYVTAPEKLNRALSQIGLVESLDAISDTLKTELKAGQILVSDKGDVLRWDGLIIKADAPSSSAIKLQQKNRLADLTITVTKAESTVTVEKQKQEQKIESLDKLKKSLEENRANLSEKEKIIKSQRDRLGSLQDEYHALKNDLTSITTSLGRIEEDFEKTNEQLTHVKDSLKLKQGNAHKGEERDRLKETLNSLTSTLNQKQITLSESLRNKDRKAMRLEQIEREIQTLQEAKKTTEQRLTSLQTRIEASRNDYNNLVNTQESVNLDGNNADSLEQKILSASKARNDKAETLGEAEQIVQTLALELREKEIALSSSKEKRAALQVTYTNCRQKISELNDAIQENFEMNAQQMISEFEIDENNLRTQSLEAYTNRLARLKNERDTMGAVNLRAELEAEEVETEINRFKTEEEELTSAIAKLRSAISRINKEARERLVEAFGKVDAHFRTLFSDLFGGGKAYLQLTDDEDPLDAGLEIFAQPPGKKLQNLTLLSGGEQTLTSIALVFAMFLTNPSPICVLDEIDAALDDANVDRVCNALDRMAAKGNTRFLVISHHRMSVARMDRLYGVTMAQRGISQLVSVDLQQSFSFLDEAA